MAETFQWSLINHRTEGKEQIGIGDGRGEKLNQPPEVIHHPTPIHDRQILVPEFRILAISPVFSPQMKSTMKRIRSQIGALAMTPSYNNFLSDNI